MTRYYKTQRRPKHAPIVAHHTLTDAGFTLKSFHRNGHEAGRFHYDGVIGELLITASVAPVFDGSRTIDIFCEGAYHLAQMGIEDLLSCDFPKIAAAWLAVRPTPNGPGRVYDARVNAVQAI